jgi:hypothetical protein
LGEAVIAELVRVMTEKFVTTYYKAKGLLGIKQSPLTDHERIVNFEIYKNFND